MLCNGRDPHVLGCEGEARSGNARGEVAGPVDGQRPGWVVGFGRMGSLREHVCEIRRDLRGVFCSQNAQRRLRTGGAHVLAWRIPRIARCFFFLCAGDVMAAHVVGIRQEGVKPCRMVPSIRDEVHGSCMTSRARSSVCG